MATKGITYAQKFCGMSASLTIFVCSSIIFLRTTTSIDMNTLIHAICIVAPAAFIVGTLGYYIGKIFDGTKKKKKLNKFMK